MKKWFLIFTLSLTISCGESKKLTAILKPLRTVDASEESLSRISDVSFLFVIDNSGSMQSTQKQMADNFKRFLPIIRQFSYYNFNFAITTMEPLSYFMRGNSPLFVSKENNKRLLSSGYPGYQPGPAGNQPQPGSAGNQNRLVMMPDHEKCTKDLDSFIQNEQRMGEYFRFSTNHSANHKIDVIECLVYSSIHSLSSVAGSPEEYYFSALNYMIDQVDQQGEFKERFFGKSSLLVILFISDTPGNILLDKEITGDVSIKQKGKLYADFQLEKIVSMKGNIDLVKVFGVMPTEGIGHSSGDLPSDNRLKYPYHALSLIEQTKGKAFYFDESDWGKNLTVISENLEESLLANYIFLKEIPFVDSLEIYFNGHKLPPESWSYDHENVAIDIHSNFKYNEYSHKNRDKKNVFTVKYHPFNQGILYEKEATK